MKNIPSYLTILVILLSQGFVYGSDAKISAALNESGIVEVVGTADGNWYAATLEYNYYLLQNIKIRVYQPGLSSFKDFTITPNLGESGQYLRMAIINNKLSVFYAQYQGAIPRAANSSREGVGNIPLIFRKDYDLKTLEPSGGAVKIFNETKDGFTASNLEITTSDDKSKVAILIKSRREEGKFKVIVYDNSKGETYNKVASHKADEKALLVPGFKVSNDGNVLVMAKSIDPTWHFGNMRSGGAVNYYFSCLTAQGSKLSSLKIASPVNKENYTTDPVSNWLSDGQVAIAYGIYKTKTGAEVHAMDIILCDADLKQLSKKEYEADPKLTQQANMLDKAKEGFNNLEFNEIMPLSGGNFILVTEYYHQKKESGTNYEHIYTYRYYAIAYRLNEKLDVVNTAFISKKQFGEDIMDFMFSVKATHIGDEVYLVYNETFESKPTDGVQLYCTHLPVSGEAQTSKLLRTNDNYFTAIDAMTPGENGKFFTPALRFKGFYNGGAKGLKFVEINCK